MKRKSDYSHPLQSKAWGEFRKAWGNKVIRIKEGLLTIHKIPFTRYSIGMFIKCPMPTGEMLKNLKKLAASENLIFIKMEPNVARNYLEVKRYSSVIKLLKENGAVPGKTLFTPTTFWIDLTPSEEELLKSFSGKTRYNIRLAQKHGVTVKEDNSEKAFREYIRLTRETVERQGFYAHSEKYHRLMWKYLRPSGEKNTIAHLLTAVYKREVVTAWIVFAYKDFLYYPYGASSEKHKNVMANNLIMWEAIRLGKRMGLKTFDLWGREEGKGFTKFKEGYNPEVVEFLGTWDLVINKPIYSIYRFAEKLRWKLLRLRTKISPVKPKF